MFPALLIGAVTAVVATAPLVLHERLVALTPAGQLAPGVVALALGGVLLAALLVQRLVLDRRPGNRLFDGLADLMVHIQLPGSPDSPFAWAWRGFISSLLAIFGGVAGPEGGAIEFGQALSIRLRDRSARWFEQRRRTDASGALAGAFAAAFGTPFAAVLLPVELGIGGRHQSTAASALISYFLSRVLQQQLMLHAPEFGGVLHTIQVRGIREWILTFVVAVGAGLLATGLIRFIHRFKRTLLDLFGRHTGTRLLVAGLLLCLLAGLHAPGGFAGSAIFEKLLWARIGTQESAVLLAAHFLGLAAVLAGFGTTGVFWPVLALGALLGYGLNHWVPLVGMGTAVGEGSIGFSAAAALVGGTALWSAVFGVPLTAAVAAWELSGNVGTLVPAFAAGTLALWVRRQLRTGSLLDSELKLRGMDLLQGKSLRILESLLVRDAMVTDHETVPEQEPVSELHVRILRARYPFLPVVNGQGLFTGLLTVDMVQEAWLSGNAGRPGVPAPAPPPPGEGPRVPLVNLLEAKDLLYRFGAESRRAGPRVKVTDRLSTATLLTSDHACIPVLSEDGRVAGLLFAHNVRLAYDREVARRSLTDPPSAAN